MVSVVGSPTTFSIFFAPTCSSCCHSMPKATCPPRLISGVFLARCPPAGPAAHFEGAGAEGGNPWHPPWEEALLARPPSWPAFLPLRPPGGKTHFLPEPPGHLVHFPQCLLSMKVGTVGPAAPVSLRSEHGACRQKAPLTGCGEFWIWALPWKRESPLLLMTSHCYGWVQDCLRHLPLTLLCPRAPHRARHLVNKRSWWRDALT